MLDLTKLTARLLNDCKENPVGLWTVVWEVRYELHGGKVPSLQDDRSEPQQVRHVSMQLIERLLTSGVQAGFPAPDGTKFIPWVLTTERALDRISAEWTALGREPTMGEVVWFRKSGV
jgi:hypothetical protein